MRVTILGCGTSVGVPALGAAGWGRCNPDDPRNRRQRCALLVETDEATILVDAGPDIRNQLLPHQLKRIDALLITHTHADHIAGLDELRAFYWPDKINLPVYATAEHAEDIVKRFPYLFEKNPNSPPYFVPPMELRTLHTDSEFQIKDCVIKTYYQMHGNTFSVGFNFNNQCAYSTDVKALSDDCLTGLAGIPLWIVESLRPEPHSSHAHYDLTFEWIAKVKPGRAILTHLGLEADYAELSALCPAHVEPGQDGLQIILADKN